VRRPERSSQPYPVGLSGPSGRSGRSGLSGRSGVIAPILGAIPSGMEAFPLGRAVRLLAGALLCGSLAGCMTSCGQRGPLVLPPKKADLQRPAPATPGLGLPVNAC